MDDLLIGLRLGASSSPRLLADELPGTAPSALTRNDYFDLMAAGGYPCALTTLYRLVAAETSGVLTRSALAEGLVMTRQTVAGCRCDRNGRPPARHRRRGGWLHGELRRG